MTVQLTTLPNGFRIVSEHMPGLQSASLGVWVTAGGRHERAPQNGIAHFLEHMAFKGTQTRSALQIAEALEDVGGFLNAYTSREATAYYASVLKDDVPLALEVISDILLNPVYDPREIEVERGVILQEIGQSLDTPDDVIFDWLQAQAYPDQPLGRPILGPAERVRAFGRDDLLAFTGEHYEPSRMILSAAGAVDHDTLVAQASALFAGLAKGHGFDMVGSRFGGGEVRREKDLEQAHFALAFESPDVRDPMFFTAQVYSMILGGGMSSRLFQEIREKHGLCYTIYAQAGAYLDTGMTTIYAGTSGDQIAALAGLTVDELKRAADDISEQEVTRARTQLKAGLLMGLEASSQRTERMARMLQIWGRVPDAAEVIEKVDGVCRESVRDYAARIAVTAPSALALYGPVSDAPDLARIEERRAA